METITYTTSDTFTVPEGVTEITVECWGGGGAGGATTGTISGKPSAGGGGAGGSYAMSVLAVSPSDSYTVTVAAAKTTTRTNTTEQNLGNPSWFSPDTIGNALVLANGGNGGTKCSAAYENAAGAIADTTGSIGDVIYAGGNGAAGDYTNNAGAGGGGAGSTGAGGNASGATGGTGTSLSGGNGGNAITSDNAGLNGTSYGGAGSGGRQVSSNLGRAGGTGAQGLVIVSWETGAATSLIKSINDLIIAATKTINDLETWKAVNDLE